MAVGRVARIGVGRAKASASAEVPVLGHFADFAYGLLRKVRQRLVLSQGLLLALIDKGLERRVAYALAQRNADPRVYTEYVDEVFARAGLRG